MWSSDHNPHRSSTRLILMQKLSNNSLMKITRLGLSRENPSLILDATIAMIPAAGLYEFNKELDQNTAQ